jgi:hypothetical protein
VKDIFISNGMNILKSDNFAAYFVIFADTEETNSLENTYGEDNFYSNDQVCKSL